MRFRLQMYKIFVNCHRLKHIYKRFNMRKAFFLIATVFLLGCTSNNINNSCFPFISVNETVNLDLPQFIDLQVPGGWAYTTGGQQGLIIYKATNPLCDDSEFNILNGAPLTQGISCFANEYLVENLNGSILRITNF